MSRYHPKGAAVDRRAEGYAALLLAGKSLREIGHAAGLSHARIGQILQDAGLSARALRALRAQRTKPKHPAADPRPWICARCGVELRVHTTGHDRPHYCTDLQCRWKHDPEYRAARNEETRRRNWRVTKEVTEPPVLHAVSCANCGDPLTRRRPVTPTEDSLGKHYCTKPECNRVYQRERQRATYALRKARFTSGQP
jgi:hypothetical protein